MRGLYMSILTTLSAEVVSQVKGKAAVGTVHWDDFSRLAVPVAYFSDVQHLNKAGAQYYTAVLDERLKKMAAERTAPPSP